MLRKLRSRLSYANVMATIAVFIALGGSSYALSRIGSSQIQDNSIRSQDIKNNDLQGIDLRNGTIKTADVADHSLLAKDFALGQLPAGPQGSVGHQGPKGDTGPTTGASKGGEVFPPASPSGGFPWQRTIITTPTAGAVFVLGTVQASVSCSAMPCSTTFAVYLDSSLVPNAAQTIGGGANSNNSEDLTLQGIMPSVPAGTHDLTIRNEDSTNSPGTGVRARSLTGIALGHSVP
jgi:hypothetical protein